MRLWVVTLNGQPVVGTLAYTRKNAIAQFMGDDTAQSWEKYREAGYDVCRCTLELEKRT